MTGSYCYKTKKHVVLQRVTPRENQHDNGKNNHLNVSPRKIVIFQPAMVVFWRVTRAALKQTKVPHPSGASVESSTEGIEMSTAFLGC